jgi:hypothetical protein
MPTPIERVNHIRHLGHSEQLCGFEPWKLHSYIEDSNKNYTLNREISVGKKNHTKTKKN